MTTRAAMPDRARLVIYLDDQDKRTIDAIARSKQLTTSSFVRQEVIQRIIKMKEQFGDWTEDET